MKNNIQIRTLAKDDIDSLVKDKNARRWAISFYLGMRVDQNFVSVANAALSEGEKKITQETMFSESELREIKQAFSRIEDELRHRRITDRTQTLVMFFDDTGKKEIYKLPVYIPTKLSVERNFYVHPFIKSLEKYPRYCVAFLERDRARIFDLFWGELEHKTEEIRSEVPQRMNAARATWKGLEERKIQNHIEVHINRHLKKVAQAVERYMDKNKVSYLVIGSRRELIERFRAFLPKRLQKKIVGSYFTRTDQDIKKIQKRSLEIIANFEFEKERELIEQIFEGTSKKVREAIAGIQDVLSFIYDYKIRTLLVGKSYQEAGFVCADNHRLSLKQDACPVCSFVREGVNDITDEIIEEAIRQKINIIHFQCDHEDFDQFGIAAILK